MVYQALNSRRQSLRTLHDLRHLLAPGAANWHFRSHLIPGYDRLTPPTSPANFSIYWLVHHVNSFARIVCKMSQYVAECERHVLTCEQEAAMTDSFDKRLVELLSQDAST